MLLTGYHKIGNPPNYEFVDNVVQISNFSEIDGDFAVDLTSGRLILDIRPYLTDDTNVIGYYGDYIDVNGFYCISNTFPSLRGVYPGIILSTKFLKSWNGTDLNKGLSGKIVRYLPFAFFQATK